MAYTYYAFIEDDLADISSQPASAWTVEIWLRIGATLMTSVIALVVWFAVILRTEQTPYTLMVKPAAETLESGVSSSKDLTTISNELSFQVDALDLKRIGGDLTAVGKSEFGGQHAAVMQYQYGDSIILVYTFGHKTKVFQDMTQLDVPDNHFYLTSGGAVSVVAWKDKESGYRAIAAKATEKDILALAENVVGGS